MRAELIRDEQLVGYVEIPDGPGRNGTAAWLYPSGLVEQDNVFASQRKIVGGCGA
jgi:hypothetical protein